MVQVEFGRKAIAVLAETQNLDAKKEVGDELPHDEGEAEQVVESVALLVPPQGCVHVLAESEVPPSLAPAQGPVDKPVDITVYMRELRYAR